MKLLMDKFIQIKIHLNKIRCKNVKLEDKVYKNQEREENHL